MILIKLVTEVWVISIRGYLLIESKFPHAKRESLRALPTLCKLEDYHEKNTHSETTAVFRQWRTMFQFSCDEVTDAAWDKIHLWSVKDIGNLSTEICKRALLERREKASRRVEIGFPTASRSAPDRECFLQLTPVSLFADLCTVRMTQVS